MYTSYVASLSKYICSKCLYWQIEICSWFNLQRRYVHNSGKDTNDLLNHRYSFINQMRAPRVLMPRWRHQSYTDTKLKVQGP